MGGVGARGGAFAHQPGLGESGQSEIEQPVGAVTFGEPMAEIAEHTVMEPGVVQLQTERVLEVDATTHGLGRLPVGQVQHILQDAHGGQLSRGQAGSAVARIPVGEILVAPQAFEPVAYPHRRSSVRIAGAGHPRRQRRDRHGRSWSE
nr:hypothetical protein [Nocardia niigatensis]